MGPRTSVSRVRDSTPPAFVATTLVERFARTPRSGWRSSGVGGVTKRRKPDRWSALEYGCHVRDVLRIFNERARLMLSESDPTFANWDQNETATRDRYQRQDPSTVARDLDEAADELAALYDAVVGEQWDRPGTRSNGSSFTVETLAIYGLHDPIHHLWDVVSGA